MENRLLPAAPDAERSVLCCNIIDQHCLDICHSRGVEPSWFHVPAHATIYRHMVEMSNEGKHIDLITLTVALRDAGALESVGGAANISEIATYLPTLVSISHYLDILDEKRQLREAIRHCTEIALRCYEDQSESEAIIDSLERGSMAIRARRMQRIQSRHVRTLVMDAVNSIQDLYERKGAISGLSTGIPELDKLTDGLHRKEFIVIAARPSHGKTSLAMQIMEHIAVQHQKPVAIFSLEMSGEQLMQRSLCSAARVNLQRVRDGFLSDRDFPALALAASQLAGAPMFIEEGSDMSIQDLRARARRLKSQHKVEAIFIDSLSVLRSMHSKDRWREVAEVSNGCKEMAKELDIPVVVVAHLHRRADTNDRPRVSDLRESGNIEQDADSIWLLVREELLANDDETAEKLSGRATLRIGKGRSGEMNASVPLTFLKEFTRFEMRAPDESESKPVRSNFQNPRRGKKSRSDEEGLL